MHIRQYFVLFHRQCGMMIVLYITEPRNGYRLNVNKMGETDEEITAYYFHDHAGNAFSVVWESTFFMDKRYGKQCDGSYIIVHGDYHKRISSAAGR